MSKVGGWGVVMWDWTGHYLQVDSVRIGLNCKRPNLCCRTPDGWKTNPLMCENPTFPVSAVKQSCSEAELEQTRKVHFPFRNSGEMFRRETQKILFPRAPRRTKPNRTKEVRGVYTENYKTRAPERTQPNLTKEVWGVFTENYKTLHEGTKAMSGKMCSVHRLEA